MDVFSGLKRDDVSISVESLKGHVHHYICVRYDGATIPVARLQGLASEECFMKALYYIATGKRPEKGGKVYDERTVC